MLEHFLLELKSDAFILLGDLNARVGTEQTFDSNVLPNIPFLTNNRISKDKTLDAKGKKLLELLENTGGVVLNGRFSGDEKGQFTFCSGVGCSVIDYCVCTFRLIELISQLSIPSKTFSDHMPIELKFSVSNNTTTFTLPPKLKWYHKHAELYRQDISASLENNAVLPLSSDYLLDSLNSKIKDAARKLTPRKRLHYKNAWFDGKCENVRLKMLSLLNKVSATKSAVLVSKNSVVLKN